MARINTLSCSASACLVAGALLVLFPMAACIGNSISDTGVTPRDNHRPNTTRICKSMDIRNTLKSFDNLRGCRVVEGFVQILLFDNVNESAFDELRFPELTEITDFLLLYRVNGLRSVGQLFPNLAIIRGQDKVFEYSLVIYEMSSLQEIGLHSLRVIRSGLVRIDKNPSLCYVNSIDWDLIAEEKGEHFIKNIKAENECPLCPGDDDISEKSCPISKNFGRHLCWNRQHCQKVCPDECKYSCDSKGKCCDSKCLGCQVGNSSNCILCWNVTVDSNICAEKCPPNSYKFLDRRCVTSKECMSIDIDIIRPMKLQSRVEQDYPYKIFNESCVLECPSDYMESVVNGLHTCVPCEGRCKKECQGAVIDGIVSAQQFRGCTHINGSLEIQIRGGKNLVNELEESLSMVEEIGGYIKIVRSFPLVSLSFFKKLRVIHGNFLESQKYVFVVLDNQNLQDIWDWQNRSLTITNKKGRLFFHFNPKLCLDKIRTLKEKANLSDFTDLEVAPNSNGDKIACNVKELIVNVTIIQSFSIVLQWAPFSMRDHRKLLGYVVYSIEAPEKNVTMYDGRDACGGDGWRVDDVAIPDQTENFTYLLPQLKPYTQYAFYVKTYTIASEESGAQSKIYYVRTKPHQPSPPVDLTINSKGSDSFQIQWKPPNIPNGNVTYYIVTGTREVENQTEVLHQRNYCSLSNKEKYIQSIETKIAPKSNDTCQCDRKPKRTGQKIKNETDVSNQIDFEDALHNYVYIKREAAHSRRKRATNDEVFPDPKDDNEVLKNIIQSVKNKTDDGNRFITFAFRVENKLELNVFNLKHYTDYDVTIQACRNQESEDDQAHCSENSRKRVRTGKLEHADYVTGVTYNVSLSSVTLTWESSAEPNGYIIAYEIEYKKLDLDNSQPTPKCITEVEFLTSNKKCTLSNLAPGNYSLQIAARSQAGKGNFSKYIYFYIEEASSPTIITITMVVFGCLAISAVTVYLIMKRFYGPPDKLIPAINPEYVAYEPDEWEVQRENIKLLKELGQGSFGMVYEGIANEIRGRTQVRCAVKTVNEHATNRERIEFLNEASVMKAFDTAHVVRLLGVVSREQPTLVIMELMLKGDLKSYLRSHRPDVDPYQRPNNRQPPTLRRILQMAIEIADGMAYLAAKKFVHRDLAARNCMVAEDLTVKIGDFGMTRDIYETDYYRKGTKGLLPVRWMAPESLKDGLFSSSSDVWSYGVVLWEMATLASQPYQGLSNDQVLRYVIDGGIMERPDNCPDKLYDLMMRCWRHKPSDRPSFLNLCTLLVEDASAAFCQLSFYHSTAGMEARNSRLSYSPSQDDPTTPLRANEENMSITSSDNDSDQEEMNAESNTTYTVNGYVSTRASHGTAT